MEGEKGAAGAALFLWKKSEKGLTAYIKICYNEYNGKQRKTYKGNKEEKWKRK